MRVDHDGLVWIQEYEFCTGHPAFQSCEPDLRDLKWMVFSPTGRWITDVRMPSNWLVYDIGRDYVLAVVKDAMGVERVSKFQLARAN